MTLVLIDNGVAPTQYAHCLVLLVGDRVSAGEGPRDDGPWPNSGIRGDGGGGTRHSDGHLIPQTDRRRLGSIDGF
ncbi:unnamed protein product, partial [Iphiclides podalirius]